jgi:hypothetical protein
MAIPQYAMIASMTLVKTSIVNSPTEVGPSSGPCVSTLEGVKRALKRHNAPATLAAMSGSILRVLQRKFVTVASKPLQVRHASHAMIARLIFSAT